MPNAIESAISDAVARAFDERLPHLVEAVKLAVAETSREDPDTLLGLAEVARRLHKSEPAVRKLLQRKRLPGRKLAGSDGKQSRLWQVRAGDLVGVVVK
jgi:hypothetical protein